MYPFSFFIISTSLEITGSKNLMWLAEMLYTFFEGIVRQKRVGREWYPVLIEPSWRRIQSPMHLGHFK
jgi:hypothetical protein